MEEARREQKRLMKQKIATGLAVYLQQSLKVCSYKDYPNKNDEVELREPDKILAEIAVLDEESADILKGIKELVG